jgi:lysophospholipase L1-like esterase
MNLHYKPAALCGVTLLALFVCDCATVKFPGPEAGAPVIRVACLGDSITGGEGLQRPEEDGYPAQLQRLLGSGWEVRGFAAGGATVAGFSADALMNEVLAYEPQAAVILLGTNDAHQGLPKGRAGFEQAYEELIGPLMNLVPPPRLWLCCPPACFHPEVKARLADEVIPAIRAVAARKELPVIDLFRMTRSTRRRFPDGVHPDARGAQLIAREIYTGLTGERRRMKDRMSDYWRWAIKERSLY